MNVQRGIFLAFTLASSFACTPAGQKPIVTSAADQPTYAVRYPEELASVRGRFGEQENRAARESGDLGTFVSSLDTKNWGGVKTSYELADSSGKSQTYAERYEQTEGINSFFEDEKEHLNQAIAGNVAYSAKQNNCQDPNAIAGTATFSLGKSVEKQLKERLRQNSEAHSYIDAHAESFGKPAAEKLRDQADKLTELSYTVHVGAERSRQQLQRMLDESSRIKSTLDDTAKEADAFAQDTAQPEPDRKAAKARAEAARTAATRIDSETQQAKFVLDNMDARIKKLRDDYQQALKGLLEAVDQKAAETKK
jgi:chromosome segregation ATPase